MVDLQSHKLQLHPSKNINPHYDATNGNNGTNVIVKHNNLVDSVETNLTELTKFVLNYPAIIPTNEWTNITFDIYIDSVNGNDITGTGTDVAPFETKSKAIEYLASKKITRNNTTINFYLSGNFNVPINLSSVIVDIDKTETGEIVANALSIVPTIYINFNKFPSGDNYTFLNNYSEESITFPNIITKIITKVNVNISLTNANLISDNESFQLLNFNKNLITLSYNFFVCNFTNTNNNSWCNIYIENLDYINFSVCNFTTSTNLWTAIEAYSIRRFDVQSCEINGYNTGINFDNQPVTANIRYSTFSNIGWSDVYIPYIIDFSRDGTTFLTGINSNKMLPIPFFFGSLPTGTIFLMEASQNTYSLSKIITKCGTGSFTFNLQINGNTVPLSSNSANTNKSEHNLTGLRVVDAGTDINLINVTGTATNVTIILVFEFIG